MNTVRAFRNFFWATSLASLLAVGAGCAPQTSDDPSGNGGSSPAGAAGRGGSGSPGAAGSGGPGAAGTGGRGAAGQGGNAGPGIAGNGGPGVAGSGGPGTGGSGVAGSGPGAGGRGGTVAPTGTGGNAAGGTTGAAGTTGSGGSGSTVVVKPPVVTSTSGMMWKVGTVTEVTSGTVDVTVNDTSASQTWSGFGGTFNEAGWVALNVLSAAEKDRAIKLLFDANDGAHFVYGRIPIGASDYATSRYTLAETPNDLTMTNFSIARDQTNLIPYIQAALAINPNLHLWGSPWSPPAWMKTNNNIDGGRMVENDPAIFEAHALYLAKFVEEYGKVGIKIEAIHPQNEPGYETRYPSCLWSGDGMARFIGMHLGPTFMRRGITAEIFVGTMSNDQTDGQILSAVNGDATARGFVKGYGLQWNMMGSVSGLKSRNLPIVQTEHKCGNYHWNPAGFPPFNPDRPPNDYAYGVESWGYIRDWIKAGVHIYSAWNMVLDTIGKNIDTMRQWPQNALLVVDKTARTLTPTPAYYVFRHVSQYVDPGAKVVGATGSDTLAFKNPDGSVTVAIYNSGAAKRMIVSALGKRLQFDMPGNGFATLNVK